MPENDNKHVRLKQRIANLERAVGLLDDALDIGSPTLTERAGIIQFYEMAFELTWKCLKDYLEVKGFNPKYPRDTLKMAVQYEIIDQGETWLKALTDRNLTSHIYDEKTSVLVEQAIRNEYHPLLQQVHSFMKKL
ncbi:MAG: HI0074 family nucleotidyltransferase substrate-binding subunit [Balneolales bacterium]